MGVDRRFTVLDGGAQDADELGFEDGFAEELLGERPLDGVRKGICRALLLVLGTALHALCPVAVVALVLGDTVILDFADLAWCVLVGSAVAYLIDAFLITPVGCDLLE